jgi:hypothetical protein
VLGFGWERSLRLFAAALPLLGVGCDAQPIACGAAPYGGLVWPTFHGGAARTGWNDAEPTLTPAAIASGRFGLSWSSPPFDSVSLGQTYGGRSYASPLYADDVAVATPRFTGRFDVIFAGTTSGVVYAVDAVDTTCSGGDVAAGTTLWSTTVASPTIVPGLDGGSPLGVLSTPALDPAAGRLYVTALDASGGQPVWKLDALDVGSGAPIAGFPVTLDAAAIEPVDQNGPCSFETDATQLSQRAALALDPAANRVYVAFGGFSDTVAGWVVAVDTSAARVASSFCAGRSSPLGQANGGIWGAGGPALDAAGSVYVTTGNGPPSYGPDGVAGTWGDSLLALASDLGLSGTYSPWNYCMSDANDADIGGSSPVLLPDLGATGATTPRLVAFGSKQGNVYLLERDALPGSLTSRQACQLDETWQQAASDGSLLPPPGPPYCDPNAPTSCVGGPLNVFGPYSDAPGANEDDAAKMHTTLAYFADASGAPFLFATGASKASDGVTSVPPSLARLRVNATSGSPAYLSVDAVNPDVTLVNPGSPVVSSSSGAGAVVWVVDENGRRTQPLVGSSPPHPVLYAFDGATLQLLYQSGAADLDVGGKYDEPVVAHGTVFVATDRIQAFALAP